MAGCIAIGSRAAIEPLVHFLVLPETMDVQFNCVIIKRLQLKRKKIKFHTSVFDTVRVKYRKGTMFIRCYMTELIKVNSSVFCHGCCYCGGDRETKEMHNKQSLFTQIKQHIEQAGTHT